MAFELARRWSKPGETEWVGVALAVRLGLERVHRVDDPTADPPTVPGGAMALYRAYHSTRVQDLAYRSDFGANFVEPSSEGFGRRCGVYRETRNLRMVANIRDVLGPSPGKWLLAIVGASHKGYYEAYLNKMHDVRLVDAQKVLR